MNVWSLFNVALLGLSVWTGYSQMAPEKLAHSNPDVTFCTATLVGTIAFSFAARCSQRLAVLFPRADMIKILQEIASRALARRG